MADDVDPASLAQSVVIDTILEYYHPEEIDDLDVTASYEDGELTVDAYLHVAGEDTADIVTEAIEAAATAVDEELEDDTA